MQPTQLRDLTERLERAEAALMADVGEVSGPADELLGISARSFGGGIALSVRNDPTDYWSKAQGFGWDRPIDAALIGEVLEFYRDAGTAAVNFHLPAAVLPPDWDTLCTTYGLRRTGDTVKAVRPAGDAPAVNSSLRIEPIGPQDLAAWVSLSIGVFELPDGNGGFSALLDALADLPAATAYGAWDGDRLVAGGMLVIVGDVAECVNGATLPAYRGRGAQSALVARRIEDAAAAGCRWVASETAAPGPGERNQSLANLLRLGFEVAYERPTYVWKP